MERTLQYRIPSSDEGNTIADFLKKQGYSRQNITALKKMPESIRIDGRWEYVSYRLKAGDHLVIHIQEKNENTQIKPAALPFTIVYEDEDLLVVDKPSGMPTHPSIHNYDNTLANAVCYYYHSQGIPFIFRCINRLDRDTTGLTILAKHMLSAGILSDMVSKREILREYLAIVHDDSFSQPSSINPSCDRISLRAFPHGVIDAPISRQSDSIIKRIVDPEHGEKAVTHYHVLSQKNGYVLLSLKLETGRTHQIRVHMSHIGHPLLGDSLYGGDVSLIPRQALHAHKLTFLHPITKEPLCFISPLPSDMKQLV